MPSKNTARARLLGAAAPALVLATAMPAGAADVDVYAGVGLTGATLGVGTAPSPMWSLRGEYAGGISVNKDGRQGDVDYTGSLKIARGGLFADWHPLSGSFRLTGGVTFNDIQAKLQGRGGLQTINGKSVDLSNETFDVTVKYPAATPYVGLGWGHHARNGGLGFFADLGVMAGKFKVDANTTVVGKYGITQADVDAEVAKARDAVSRYNLFPSLTLGLGYQF